MKSTVAKISCGIVAFAAVCAAAELISHAQAPRPAATPSTAAPSGRPSTSTTPVAALDAEREQIWNSPNMLRARAWLEDYCSRSAKITPAEKQQYMTELQNLSPAQMKLWLVKFDHEEEARQQQHSMWEQAHSAALSRAMTADKATQQSYAAINRGENAAADQAQRQIDQRSSAEQELASDKQLEVPGAYGPYGYQGYGGVHYHFHMYPY